MMKTEHLSYIKATILTGIVATISLIIGVVFASSMGWTSQSLAAFLPGGHSGDRVGGLIQQASLPLTVDDRGSSPFVAVAERLMPSVVHIKVTTALQRQGSDLFGFGPEFFGIPNDRFHQDMEEMNSSGSGVIIDSEGYILTNNHVVERATELTVVLADKQEVKGTVVGTDPETDVAVVKIDAQHAKGRAAQLGNSDDVRIGDWAIAIGSPYGLEQTLTVGVISAKGRANLNIGGGGPVFQNFFQTDAAINFGNSGGPLLNIHGQIVAINTAVNAQAQGIGFAIPVNMARKVYEDLRDHGSVTRGYLGMVPRELSADLKKAMGLDEEVKGVFVDSVQEDGPAAEGGLMDGDVVLSWNGQSVEDVGDFRMRVAQTSPGKSAKARILRDGEEMTLTFTLGDRALAMKDEAGAGGVPAPVEPARLGLKVAEVDDIYIDRYKLNEDLVKRSGGVVITSLTPDSPARRQLRAGDVITRLDRTPIRSVKDFVIAEREMKDKSAVLVHVIRGNRKTIEAIDLGE